MRIFNSLGSNYLWHDVTQTLSAYQHRHASATQNAVPDLENFLAKTYGGEVALLYKGREAIELALRLLSLPPGTAVAVNGFTCFAVYEAVANQGYEAVYLDIDQTTMHFSAKTLTQAVKNNPNIKVVMIQNTLGYPCDIEGIAAVCKKNNLFLIEDLAHSIGTMYSTGQEAGTVGDFTVLSFSQDKVVDAVSGGALVVRHQEYQEALKATLLQPSDATQQRIDSWYPLSTYLIRSTYGWGVGKVLHKLLHTFNWLSKPMTSRNTTGFHALPAWQASLVLEKFTYLDELHDHRTQLARVYAEHLPAEVLVHPATEQSSNLRFPIKVSDPKSLISFLKHHHIYISDIWYDAPIGPQKYMNQTTYDHHCPLSEELCSHILNLPTHINVTPADAQRIAELVTLWHNSPSNP